MGDTNRKYVQDAVRAESADMEKIGYRLGSKTNVRLLHAAMGMSTESAELLDALKKHIFYGKPLDITNLKEEIGDIMWYIAIACDTMGFDLTQIMSDNIEKLRKRYPEKFSEDNAINRDTDNELKHMEATFTCWMCGEKKPLSQRAQTEAPNHADFVCSPCMTEE